MGFRDVPVLPDGKPSKPNPPLEGEGLKANESRPFGQLKVAAQRR